MSFLTKYQGTCPPLLMSPFVFLFCLKINTPFNVIIKMDEIHTYIGEQGSEVAALLRRLKCLCADPERIRFVGTSATVASGSVEEMTRSVRRFASRLFGVEASSVKCVFEQFKAFDKLSLKELALI